MNTFVLRRTTFLLAGGVIGGLVGYYLSNLILSKIVMKEEEEWGGDKVPPITSSREIEVTEEVVKEKKNKKQHDYTKFSKEKGDLSKLVEPYTVSSIDPDGTINLEEKPQTYEHIKIITLDEFTDDRHQNKDLISYYEGDTTYADAEEKPIPNPVSLFGPNIHLHFGEESEDPDIVYVRNEKLGTDYEITRIRNKYSILVLGMPDESKASKSKRRRAARKVSAKNDDENDDEDKEKE